MLNLAVSVRPNPDFHNLTLPFGCPTLYSPPVNEKNSPSISMIAALDFLFIVPFHDSLRTVKINSPDQSPCEGDCAEDFELVTLDVNHNNPENIAKEVAPGPHCRCPNQGAQGVKEEEITPPYPAHAESKGGYCAQTIKEAESKNQGSLVESKITIGLDERF